jgi:hypothetical protein
LEWIAEFNDGQKWLVGKALVVLKNKPASETGRQAVELDSSGRGVRANVRIIEIYPRMIVIST